MNGRPLLGGGEGDLAAATLAKFLFNLMSYALIGLTSAAAPLIAAEIGRRAHAVREARRSFRMALWVGLLCCIPTMLLVWQGGDWRQDLLSLRPADGALERARALPPRLERTLRVKLMSLIGPASVR